MLVCVIYIILIIKQKYIFSKEYCTDIVTFNSLLSRKGEGGQASELNSGYYPLRNLTGTINIDFLLRSYMPVFLQFLWGETYNIFFFLISRPPQYENFCRPEKLVAGNVIRLLSNYCQEILFLKNCYI